MKTLSFITKLALPLALLFSPSCQTIKAYKANKAKQGAVVFNYDSKSLFLKAPKDYCFYDEKNPAEMDVVDFVRDFNDFGKEGNSEVKFLLQKCEEKQNFLRSDNPRFRNTVMISFRLPSYLERLKKYGVERNRETYVKVSSNSAAEQNTQSLNKFMKKILPQMRKRNVKTLDNLQSLSTKQKNELKLVHGQVFGKETHNFLSYHSKLEWGVAAYDYQFFKVGKIFTKCVNSDTLINYIPVTLTICEEGELADDWMDLDRRISEYTWALIRLNSEE